MKPYLLSLAAGFAVGIFYAVISVRSPAPPVIALVGLLGILFGEQAVPLFKRLVSAQPVSVSWVRQTCGEHVFGELPSASAQGARVLRVAGAEPGKQETPR